MRLTCKNYGCPEDASLEKENKIGLLTLMLITVMIDLFVLAAIFFLIKGQYTYMWLSVGYGVLLVLYVFVMDYLET